MSGWKNISAGAITGVPPANIPDHISRLLSHRLCLDYIAFLMQMYLQTTSKYFNTMRNEMNMKTLRFFGVIRENFWVYLSLAAGTLLSWLPLLGHSLPVADDFAYMRVVNDGGVSGYIHVYGFFRPLGQFLPIWLLLKNPCYPPVLVLLTHLLAVFLFYHLCRLLFGGVRLAVSAALVFAMFPFGYEALTAVINCNYVLPVPFFLANLLLLTNHAKLNWPTPVLFCLSSLLALLTALSNECLFFVTIFSGCFVWINAPKGSLCIARLVRGRGLLTWAPLVGCIVWLALYYGFPGSDIQKQITVMHPASVLSVWFRQYSLLDIFVPWVNPVCRHFLFAGWNWATGTAVVACGVLFLVGLGCLPKATEPNSGINATAPYTLAAILALLFGASLIFAVGGGFSLDSRKKYPLVLLLLLFGCWTYRVLFKGRRVSTSSFLACATIGFGIAAMTTWLIVGIWKHETICYNSLADFITDHKIHGNIEVRWHPDLWQAWPQMSRTLGHRFDDTWVINLAVASRGGNRITNSSNNSTVVEYDVKTSSWVVGNH